MGIERLHTVGIGKVMLNASIRTFGKPSPDYHSSLLEEGNLAFRGYSCSGAGNTASVQGKNCDEPANCIMRRSRTRGRIVRRCRIQQRAGFLYVQSSSRFPPLMRASTPWSSLKIDLIRSVTDRYVLLFLAEEGQPASQSHKPRLTDSHHRPKSVVLPDLRLIRQPGKHDVRDLTIASQGRAPTAMETTSLNL